MQEIEQIVPTLMSILGHGLALYSIAILAFAQIMSFRIDNLKINVQIHLILAWLFQAVALIVGLLRPEALSPTSYLFIGISLSAGNTNIIGDIHNQLKDAIVSMKYIFTSSFKNFVTRLHEVKQ